MWYMQHHFFSLVARSDLPRRTGGHATTTCHLCCHAVSRYPYSVYLYVPSVLHKQGCKDPPIFWNLKWTLSYHFSGILLIENELDERKFQQFHWFFSNWNWTQFHWKRNFHNPVHKSGYISIGPWTRKRSESVPDMETPDPFGSWCMSTCQEIGIPEAELRNKSSRQRRGAVLRTSPGEDEGGSNSRPPVWFEWGKDWTPKSAGGRGRAAPTHRRLSFTRRTRIAECTFQPCYWGKQLSSNSMEI